MSSASKPHSVQDDFALARRGIQGFRDPLNPSAALLALQRIEEQLEAARGYEMAAVGLSADVSRFGRALQEIMELDLDLTHDGYQRGPDSRWQDEVYSIAETALNGVSNPAKEPEAS